MTGPLAGRTADRSGEHRRTRSDVTGGYYCIYDGEDWPCRATGPLSDGPAHSDNAHSSAAADVTDDRLRPESTAPSQAKR